MSDKDPFEQGSVLKALTELVCDRLASNDDDDHPYLNVVPMRITNDIAVITLVLSGPVTHLTESGLTELPPGSAITLVVQEWTQGDAEKWQTPDYDPNDNAHPLWDLRRIVNAE